MALALAMLTLLNFFVLAVRRRRRRRRPLSRKSLSISSIGSHRAHSALELALTVRGNRVCEVFADRYRMHGLVIIVTVANRLYYLRPSSGAMSHARRYRRFRGRVAQPISSPPRTVANQTDD